MATSSSASRSYTRDIAYIAVFAALIVALGFFSIPLAAGVPIVLQNIAFWPDSSWGHAAVHLLLPCSSCWVLLGFRYFLAGVQSFLPLVDQRWDTSWDICYLRLLPASLRGRLLANNPDSSLD